MIPEKLWQYYQKERIDLQKSSIIKNDDGSVLIYALLILILLTIIGLSSIQTTNVELKISGNDKFYKIAFYACDAGIEAGRAALNDLKKADSGSWDKLLRNEAVTLYGRTGDLDAVIGSGCTVGAATYTLAVADNLDLSSPGVIDAVDTDNTIFLTSTVVNYMGAQVQIQTTVRYSGQDVFAQEHYDSSSSGQAGDEDAAATSDIRW
jgi:Tfp pilus assembly protein PilX